MAISLPPPLHIAGGPALNQTADESKSNLQVEKKSMCSCFKTFSTVFPPLIFLADYGPDTQNIFPLPKLFFFPAVQCGAARRSWSFFFKQHSNRL